MSFISFYFFKKNFFTGIFLGFCVLYILSYPTKANIIIIGNMPNSYETTMAENLCLLWNSKHKTNNTCTVYPSQDAIQQMDYLSKNTSAFAIVSSDWSISSYKGLDIFQSKGKNTNFQWLATLNSNALFVFSNKAVKSINKLKNATMYYSTGDTYARFIAKTLNSKNNLNWHFESIPYNQLFQQLCYDKKMVGFISFAPTHNENLQALIQLCHLSIINDSQEWKTLASKLPGYLYTSLPSNHWMFPNKTIYTLQNYEFLLVNKNMPKKIKKMMLLMIQNNQRQLKTIMPGLKNPKSGLPYSLRVPKFTN